MRLLIGFLLAFVASGIWGFLSQWLFGIPIITAIGSFAIVLIIINIFFAKKDD